MATAEGVLLSSVVEVPIIMGGSVTPVPSTPERSSAGSTPLKCPWSSSPVMRPQVASLAEIMSEQMASDLQLQEEEKFVKETLLSPDEFPLEIEPFDEDFLATISSPSDDTSSDFVIAQMLQMQYSKEYDSGLKRVEQKYNGKSKVSVSLDNYMMSPTGGDSDSDDESDLPPPKTWDSFEAHEKAFPQMPRCGYVKVNNQLVTKHDMTMNGRRNACRVMESFPPCIHTGDAGSFDMQLSNKVYNKLKAYSKAEENRRTRVHDKKDKSTSELAMDAKTRLMLYKLINNSVLQNVHGIISTGKEAVVLYANGGSFPEIEGETKVEIPAECAIKVFKTTLNEFKTRDKYIRDDYRFKDRFSKQNPRKVIHLWAEKEMHNLSRIAKAGIPCPPVVLLKKHVLILGFIGSDMRAAPKLKEVKFPDDDDDVMLNSAYSQIIDMMIRLYKQCNLVHADFSEYNILWHEQKCFVIDVSQSVEPSHPNALEFLYRDCTNIAHFFGKKGVKDCHTPESLFAEVCGYQLDGTGPEIINQIKDYEKNLELLTFAKPEKSFAFDYCWDKIQRDQQSPSSSQHKE